MSVTNYINTDNPRAYGAKPQSLSTPVASPKAAEQAAKSAVSGTKTADKASGSEEFSFWDLVDIVNPLQHIPVVSTIYRELTGDKINNFARVAGGTLFGGFAGAIIGGINAVAVNETGSDVGQLAMHSVGIGTQEAPVQVASKDKSVPVAAPVAAPLAAKPAAKSVVPENIPMIEVRPMAQKKVPHAEEVAMAKDLNGIEPGSSNNAVAENPEAMPDPVALNALEPGNPDSVMPQVVEPAQVPHAMMQALAKYEAMQKLGAQDKTNIIPDKMKSTGEIASAEAPHGQRKFVNLGKDVRRY